MITEIQFKTQTGIDYLNKVILDICKSSNADYAFVGHYNKNKNNIETISLCNKAVLLANFKYDLSETPCNNVVASNACVYSKNVQQLFPQDYLLQEMGIEGYAGYPLFSIESNNLIGILILLFKKELHTIKKVGNLFKLMAPRIELELDRHLLVSKLKETESKRILIHEELERSKDLEHESNKLSKVGAWEIDMNTFNSYWTKNLRMLLEVPEDFIPTLDAGIAFYKKGKSRNEINQLLSRVLEFGEGFDVISKAVTHKGNDITIRTIAQTIFQNGKCIRFYGSVQDITNDIVLEQKLKNQNQRIKIKNAELRNSQKKLAESEKRYKEFSNLSVEAIAIHQNGIIKDVNKSASIVFGYSYDEFINLDGVHSLVHPDDMSIVVDKIKNQNESPCLVRFIKKGGKIIIGEIKSKNILYKNEKARVFVVKDISESIIAHDKLQKSEAKFRDLFEKSEDANLLIVDGIFKDCNLALIEMLGYGSKNEIIDFNPSQVSPEFQPDGETSIKKAEEMIQLALKNSSYRFEWILMRKSGDTFHAEVALTTISKKPNTEIIHAVIRDITERKKDELSIKQYQKKLENRNLKLENIAWSFSHNVRSPLSTIMGLSNIFNYKNGQDPINKEILLKLQEPTLLLNERISKIVGDINKLSYE